MALTDLHKNWIVSPTAENFLRFFNECYHLHWGSIYRFCLKMLHDEFYACEVADDTFLNFWKVKSAALAQPDFNAGAYLQTIAKNEVIRFVKKNRSFISLDESHLKHLAAPEAAEGFRRSIQEELSKNPDYFLSLKLNAQEMTILQQWLQGKDYRTIAMELGISLSTVGNSLSIARSKLRERNQKLACYLNTDDDNSTNFHHSNY